MFAQQIFQDFKENLKSTAPAKTSGPSRKGLASRSLNSFQDSSNVIKKKKNTLDEKSCHFFSEKSDVKPKINLQEKKVDLRSVDEAWSDIEEMHICDEPEDDYEDILPQCERIQQADIDALFVNYTFTKYAELTADKLPSPLKEVEGQRSEGLEKYTEGGQNPTWIVAPLCFDFPEFSPPLPDFKATLFDDSELDFIPLSNNLCLL